MGQHNMAAAASSSTSRKRPRNESTSSYSNHQDSQVLPAKKKAKSKDVEKRLRRFRPKPPQSFLDVHERAISQRFYVLSRTPYGDDWCPEEEFEITGSTGNIYNVTIGREPTCNCPHAQKGHQCKHVIFVLARVLRAKPDYIYQLALLSEELRDIFRHAPVPANEQAAAADRDRKRKPVEGECSICYEDLQTGSGSGSGSGSAGEALVWCKAACGQNLHRQCFNMWSSTKRGSGENVTCPYCRSKWETDDGCGGEVDLASVKQHGRMGQDGYLNVAKQLGISTVRDHSTYSRWWSGNRNGYRRRYG